MAEKIRCLIVEDEPIAAEVMEDYISQIPHLELISSCRDAFYAMAILQKEEIDLLFLDIHLPKLKGIDFVKSLRQKPHIIFTTAYHQYAVEGFELEALDYLLKPVSFPRFLKAVNKIPREKSNPNSENISLTNQNLPANHLFFTINKKHVKFLLDDILFVESLKDYVRIHTIKKQWLIKYKLSELEQRLPTDLFVRIHRSYIVAVPKITAYTKEFVEIGEQQIPIGRTYKEILKGRF